MQTFLINIGHTLHKYIKHAATNKYKLHTSEHAL